MRNSPRWLLPAFVAVGFLGLFGAGVWFYRAEEGQLRQRLEGELSAVVTLELEQFLGWRRERLSDAAVLMRSSFFNVVVAKWLSAPSPQQGGELAHWLEGLRVHSGYSDVRLVDAAGAVKLSLAGETVQLDDAELKALELGWRERRPVFTDLHVSGSSLPHVAVVAPISVTENGGDRLVGAMTLVTEAQQFLAPLLRSWPVPSRTAEVLLMCREGNELLVLGARRTDRRGGIERIPADRGSLFLELMGSPSRGVVRGLDHRGVPSLAVIRPVPDSRWYFAARMDVAEVFEEWRARSTLLIVFLAGLAVLAAVVVKALWEWQGQKHRSKVGSLEAARLRSEAQHRSTLEEREAWFRSLIERSADIITVIDSTGVIVFQSPSVERLLGYRPEELQGRNAFELTHPEDAAVVRGSIQRALGNPGAPLAIHHRMHHRDGTWRVFESSGRVLDGAHRPNEIVVNSRDVTEVEKLEAQLLQAQKMEAIGQLAGGVAHDFNNILAVIMMQVEAITYHVGLSEETRQALEEIQMAAKRAADLTRQLLVFSRRQVMQPRTLDLNDAVSNLTKMLRRILGEDIQLELKLHPTPMQVWADAGMLDQVVMNLAVNARDAMPGGGRLVIETRRLSISDEPSRPDTEVRPGNFACLHVSDTGQGIPPDVLPRIFEPFFTTKEPGKGTGLGLATVFGIVKQHGGWLRVYSEPGQGTTFRIFLPISESASDLGVTGGPAKEPVGGSETILLVEDDGALRMLSRHALEQRGYRVLEATNGREALEVWREHSASIHLLLTDMVMPGGVNGRELARQVQHDRPQTRIVFMSGYSVEVAGRELTLEEGHNFVLKPCSSSQLLSTVRRCLDG